MHIEQTEPQVCDVPKVEGVQNIHNQNGEVIITRLYVIKSKERRIDAKNLGGKAIDQVDNSGQCLNPEMRRNRSLKK